jgi:hypothetical protein
MVHIDSQQTQHQYQSDTIHESAPRQENSDQKRSNRQHNYTVGYDQHKASF